MQPFFTTNDSEFSRLEGLYIKERNPPASVKGISLNVVGVVGVCVRGPVNQPVEITSEARFLEVFGGRDYGSGGTLIGHVWKSILNKPFGKLVVCRVAAAAAVVASFTAESAAAGGGATRFRIDAASAGAWGNDVSFKVSAATDGDSNHFDLTVKYLGRTYALKNCDITTGNDNLEELLSDMWDDDARLVNLTKLNDGRPVNHAGGVDGADADGYVNLGETVTAFTSVLGTNGAIAAADYTGTGDGMELIDAYRGIGVCFVAEPDEALYAAIKAKIATLAASDNDRMWIMGSDADDDSVSTAATDAADYRDDRIIYAFNSPYTLDPEIGTSILTRPESWVASILSQTDVDIHPGEIDTKAFTAGMTALDLESLTREDYITLREAGISAFEKDEGYALVSGVTTSLEPGKEEITRRRMADYIQLGIAGFLKYSVKKKNLASRRKANKAAVSAWLGGLARAERVVDTDDDGVPQFEVDTEKLNTVAGRAAGIEKMLTRVKIVGHMLHLVLETEIGTGVSIDVS